MVFPIQKGEIIMEDLKRMCESIVDELKEIYEADWTEEEMETMMGDGLPVNFWEYFENALDIEYIIGGDGRYRGVRIMVACGGPNIWVDTRRGEVYGAWGTDTYSAWVPNEICGEIDDAFEEMYIINK